MKATGVTSQPLLDNSAKKSESKSNSKKSSEKSFGDLFDSKSKKTSKKPNNSGSVRNTDKVKLTSSDSNKKPVYGESKNNLNTDKNLPTDTHSLNDSKPPSDNNSSKEIANGKTSDHKKISEKLKTNKEVSVHDSVDQDSKIDYAPLVGQHFVNKINESTVGENPLNALSQRIAMKNFLTKMQKELDINPEELIQAFSTMTAEELMSPPEESLEKLLNNLDLTVDESAKAKTYFHTMLKQTASTSMADYLKESNSDLSIKVLSKKDLQNNRMQKDISSMSDRFFVDQQAVKENGSKQTAMATATATGLLGQEEVAKQASPDSQSDNAFFNLSKSAKSESSSLSSGVDQGLASDAGKLDVSGMTKVAPKEASALKGLVIPESLPKPEGAALSSENVMGQFTDNVSELNMENLSPKGISQGLTSDSMKLAPQSFEAEIGKVEVASEANIENGEMSSLGLNAGKESNEQNLSGDDQGGDQGLQYSQAKASESQSGNQKEFMVESRPQATEVEESENVREVVNQARLMVKKGGGEMKVQMTPHGLGEVTLKVNVENGAVNVEMLTDSQDTKKILEKGMSELKATLASHKLNVEEIKVDTSADLMGDLKDKQEDAERHFAQQFMGEFRRNNQSWRNGFYGMTGARAYSSQTQDEAENPLLNTNNNKRTSRAEGRLDLVA